ncbi:MAG TPA: saccharopine dehydrogenase NADP-binding domain-containing protein [Solirubrobacteraceae bacterium]|nr:saccharopine dehydrogenase NADP-binding domain-containing protein [Solirubrobacteraceae bacterium]
MARDYDIALFGATGFVGELTADYLAERAPHARIALAGRSLEKLESLRGRLGRGDLGLLVADVENADSIRKLAEASRLVISTVGPYLRYGEPVVAACAAAGTDYVDLTGESEFVDLMYLRYHAVAKGSGARLVHSCGFDSIPYDLGALFTVSQLPPDVPIALRGFGGASGSISGGTFHSAVGQMGRLKQSGRLSRQRRSIERNADDGRIAEGRSVRGLSGKPHKEPLVKGWVVPAPTIDPQHVLRSARLNPRYGPDFSYSHFIVTRKLRTTIGLGAGVGAVITLAQFDTTRNLLLRLRAPGSGPSAARRASSFFRVRMVADYGTKSPRERLITEVRGGDPGYGETAKMLAESALALAFDANVPQIGGGQWTPALALGEPLIERLIQAGIEFRVVETVGEQSV